MSKTACIVLPTYNEAENIPLLIPAIFEQARKITTHELHVLVVDDNSPDGTQEAVKQGQKTFPRLELLTGEKRGHGDAYQRGFAHALDALDPELLFQMDADLQHDPAMLPLFVTLAGYDFDVIIGSRFAPGGSTPDFSRWRRIQSLAGNWMIRCLGGVPRIRDCTSGYRCIRSEVYRRCDLSSLSTRGYSFHPSLLCELIRCGARVMEVPIRFPDRVHGSSKLSFRDRFEFLLNIARIRLRRSRRPDRRHRHGR